MADSDSSVTPEKKLLNLIEGQQASTATGAASKGGGSKAEIDAQSKALVSSLFSLSALKGRIAYAIEQIQGFAKGGAPINFRQVNRFVRVFTIGMCLYLVAAIIYEVVVTQHYSASGLQMVPQEIAELLETEVRQIDPSLFDEVELRNIFMPYDKRVKGGAAKEGEETSLKFVEITNNLKLAGISINPSNPSRTFCMIEDISKSVTSFLRVGDSISGLKVEQINPDVVILQFQNQSIELR